MQYTDLEQQRKYVVEKLQEQPDPEHLWECILAFQGYEFRTISGLPFTYQLKKGKNGNLTKELWIDRRKNSKSLAWSSVLKAFEKTEGRPVVVRPAWGYSGSIVSLWYILSLWSNRNAGKIRTMQLTFVLSYGRIYSAY